MNSYYRALSISLFHPIYTLQYFWSHILHFYYMLLLFLTLMPWLSFFTLLSLYVSPIFHCIVIYYALAEYEGTRDVTDVQLWDPYVDGPDPSMDLDQSWGADLALLSLETGRVVSSTADDSLVPWCVATQAIYLLLLHYLSFIYFS